MKEINLVPNQFINLTVDGNLSGKLILQNQGKDVMCVFKQALLPTHASPSYALFAWESVEVDNSAGDVWVASQQTGTIFVSPSSDIAHQTMEFPSDMYTSATEGFRRLRVDTGQTSFLMGLESRSFKQLTIAAGATYVIRATVPLDIILYGVGLEMTSGEVTLTTKVGGTPGGTFTETLPIFNRNNMSVGVNRAQIYTTPVVLTAGGTLSGGTDLDVSRIKTGLNQGNQSSHSVGAVVGDERGVGANTYYFVFSASPGDPVVGLFKIRWEDRP